MRLLPASLLAALALGGALPARAQIDSREGIELQNQILELKHDLQTLRDQIASGGLAAGQLAAGQVAAGSGSALGAARGSSGQPANSAAADVTAALLDRVSRLEDEVRNLRGHIDEVDNARQRDDQDLSKKIDDLGFRLDNGTPGKEAAATPAPDSAAPATLPATVKRRPPELALQEGNAALARRDYAAAEAAAREVLTGPKTPRAVDAHFLLARALAGKRDYAGAAVAYDDTYKASRTGAHAPDSLLGLANSLSILGEKRAACATLDQLKAEFPAARPDLREPIAAARQHANCG